jgi:hypothetical protein
MEIHQEGGAIEDNTHRSYTMAWCIVVDLTESTRALVPGRCHLHMFGLAAAIALRQQ